MNKREKNIKTKLNDKVKSHCKTKTLKLFDRLNVVMSLGILLLFVSNCNRSAFIIWFDATNFSPSFVENIKNNTPKYCVVNENRIGLRYCPYKLNKLPEIGDTIGLVDC